MSNSFTKKGKVFLLVGLLLVLSVSLVYSHTHSGDEVRLSVEEAGEYCSLQGWITNGSNCTEWEIPESKVWHRASEVRILIREDYGAGKNKYFSLHNVLNKRFASPNNLWEEKISWHNGTEINIEYNETESLAQPDGYLATTNIQSWIDNYFLRGIDCLVDETCSEEKPYCGGDNQCKECLIDEHCEENYECKENVCAPICIPIPEGINKIKFTEELVSVQGKTRAGNGDGRWRFLSVNSDGSSMTEGVNANRFSVAGNWEKFKIVHTRENLESGDYFTLDSEKHPGKKLHFTTSFLGAWASCRCLNYDNDGEIKQLIFEKVGGGEIEYGDEIYIKFSGTDEDSYIGIDPGGFGVCSGGDHYQLRRVTKPERKATFRICRENGDCNKYEVGVCSTDERITKDNEVFYNQIVSIRGKREHSSNDPAWKYLSINSEGMTRGLNVNRISVRNWEKFKFANHSSNEGILRYGDEVKLNSQRRDLESKRIRATNGLSYDWLNANKDGYKVKFFLENPSNPADRSKINYGDGVYLKMGKESDEASSMKYVGSKEGSGTNPPSYWPLRKLYDDDNKMMFKICRGDGDCLKYEFDEDGNAIIPEGKYQCPNIKFGSCSTTCTGQLRDQQTCNYKRGIDCDINHNVICEFVPN